MMNADGRYNLCIWQIQIKQPKYQDLRIVAVRGGSIATLCAIQAVFNSTEGVGV